MEIKCDNCVKVVDCDCMTCHYCDEDATCDTCGLCHIDSWESMACWSFHNDDDYDPWDI